MMIVCFYILAAISKRIRPPTYGIYIIMSILCAQDDGSYFVEGLKLFCLSRLRPEECYVKIVKADFRS